MALHCGVVVYRRPCRKKPRLYTKCDLARIAKKADESNDSKDLMVSVGIALGFPVLIDASKFKGEVEYSKELKKALDEYTSIKTPAEIAAVVARGLPGLIGVLVTRVIKYLLEKQIERLAIALAPAVLKSLNNKVIIGFPCPKQSNEELIKWLDTHHIEQKLGE